MLITKSVLIEWNSPKNRKWYEEREYIFTKWKDKFEVRVEDLPDGSKAKVDVECDNCGEILTGIIWSNYKRSVKDDGKYYCHKCMMQLFGGERSRIKRLKNGISFYQWYYDNLPKELADYILSRWDYKLNVDKNGNVISPNDISYGSHGFNGKGYWFKCFDHPDKHGSELKNISSFTNNSSGVNLQCIQCNSISMTHPYLVKFLINPNDALKYSMGSTKIKIPMLCPNCGYKKKKTIGDLKRQGFCCPKCGDGKSYPEKFFFNFLEQLVNKCFKTQLSRKTFKWCGKYRYDFYIIEINGICEVGGLQHYEEIKGWKLSLKEVQQNDKDKEDLARENDIENYIIIDCRKSEMNWIKNSIMTSKPSLPELLNFKEEDIDWLKCHEAGFNSLVKTACGLWNSGIDNAQKISELLGFNKDTVIKYLKQGAEMGWCNYNVETEREKNHRRIKVICLTNGEIFNSIKDAKIKYSIQDSGISQCCNNKQKTCGKDSITNEPLKWMYYNKYIEDKIDTREEVPTIGRDTNSIAHIL